MTCSGHSLREKGNESTYKASDWRLHRSVEASVCDGSPSLALTASLVCQSTCKIMPLFLEIVTYYIHVNTSYIFESFFREWASSGMLSSLRKCHCVCMYIHRENAVPPEVERDAHITQTYWMEIRHIVRCIYRDNMSLASKCVCVAMRAYYVGSPCKDRTCQHYAFAHIVLTLNLTPPSPATLPIVLLMQGRNRAYVCSLHYSLAKYSSSCT